MFGFSADEAVHDYFSGMASNVLNSGEVMGCLLEIYDTPEAVKEFLEENAGLEGSNEAN